jgi:hypothetical protein
LVDVVVLDQLLVLVEMIEKMLMILMMNKKMSLNPYLALLFLSEEKTHTYTQSQSESRIITYVFFVSREEEEKKILKKKKIHQNECTAKRVVR